MTDNCIGAGREYWCLRPPLLISPSFWYHGNNVMLFRYLVERGTLVCDSRLFLNCRMLLYPILLLITWFSELTFKLNLGYRQQTDWATEGQYAWIKVIIYINRIHVSKRWFSINICQQGNWTVLMRTTINKSWLSEPKVDVIIFEL